MMRISLAELVEACGAPFDRLRARLFGVAGSIGGRALEQTGSGQAQIGGANRGCEAVGVGVDDFDSPCRACG